MKRQREEYEETVGKIVFLILIFIVVLTCAALVFLNVRERMTDPVRRMSRTGETMDEYLDRINMASWERELVPERADDAALGIQQARVSMLSKRKKKLERRRTTVRTAM